MNECYICTSITDEMSPCECKAHVHKKCLQTWIEKSGYTKCSICKTELEGMVIIRPEYSEEEENNDERQLRLQRFNKNVTNGIKIFYWFICGFLGKTILALMFRPSIMYIPEYWSPFDIVFILSASILYLFFKTSFTSFLYLRTTVNNQYEDIFSDDDDDDDSDGDIV